MSRPVWKGYIAFGLVNIPVTVHSAEDKNELHFSMLDKSDLSPIKYLRVNERTGEEVPYKQIVRGYEYRDGEYVLVSDKDFRRANVKATHFMALEDFTDPADIDPVYFDKPYYLEPQEDGEKGYALLREALRRTGKVGICRIVLHSRQRLAAIMVRDEMLMLEILRFHHELKDPAGLDLPSMRQRDLGLSAREIQIAEQLIEGMSAPWRPEKYQDTYYDELREFIENKAQQGEIEAVEDEGEPAEIETAASFRDLLPLLKKSLDAADRAGGHLPPASPSRGRRAERNERSRQ